MTARQLPSEMHEIPPFSPFLMQICQSIRRHALGSSFLLLSGNSWIHNLLFSDFMKKKEKFK
jgi:hypothetical protein